MGINRPKRTHKDKKCYKKARRTKRRAKDLDQIQGKRENETAWTRKNNIRPRPTNKKNKNENI